MNDLEGSSALEKFYVYRSLHSDESWGAVLVSGEISKLPNIAFGMKVFAFNEKEAIGKAKQIYDRLHVYDNDKRNIREFAIGALRYFSKMGPTAAANKAMAYAIKMNDRYKKHFEKLTKEEEKNE